MTRSTAAAVVLAVLLLSGCLRSEPCGGYRSATWEEPGLYDATAAYADPLPSGFPFSHAPHPDASLVEVSRLGWQDRIAVQFNLKATGELEAGVPIATEDGTLRSLLDEFLQNVTAATAEERATWEADFLASRAALGKDWFSYHVRIGGPWRFDEMFLARTWKETASTGHLALHAGPGMGGTNWSLKFDLPTHTVSDAEATITVDSADQATARLPGGVWNQTEAQASVDRTLMAAAVERHRTQALEWSKVHCD